MARAMDRLRRTALLVPRFLLAHRSGAALSIVELASAVGATPATLVEDVRGLEAIEFEGSERPNYFAFAIDGDVLRVSTIPIMFSGQQHAARLTEAEATALLGFLDDLELDDGADSALDGLAATIARSAGAPDGLRSWSSGGPIPAEAVFTPLLGAVRVGRRCRISYTGRGGRLYDVLVDPYHLRMERGMWYVIARLAEGDHTGEERVYRVDKIAAIEVLWQFDPQPIDLQKYADGVFVPSCPPKTATVVFRDAVAPYAEERWGPGKRVPSGVEIKIEYYDEGWLERTLAVFGTGTWDRRLRAASGA